MKSAFLIAGSIALAFSLPSAAFAYALKNATSDGCGGDRTECVVYCQPGDRAGSMLWNGSVWTDGETWDANRDAQASKIIARKGSDCT